MKVTIFQDIAPYSPYKNQRITCIIRLLARLIFDSENGGDTFLLNVGSYGGYTALYFKR
jgi:hypothetical protein